MLRNDRPTFTVVVGTSTPLDRRLLSVEIVRALTGLDTDDIDDTTLGLLIDAALATCARYCKLARAGALPATFARESVRATWPDVSTLDLSRGSQVLLPWRAPITTIAVTEDGVELEEDVDFRLLGAGILERLGACWSNAGIVADYTAGWIPTPADASYEESEGEPMPADLAALIAEQVRMQSAARDRDPALRSESTAEVGSASYSVVGGSSIGASGLLMSLEDALAPYRNLVAS